MKLSDVQTKLQVPKGRLNKFGGYYYRNCEDILNAFKEISRGQAVIILSDEVVEIGGRVYVKATAHFVGEDEHTVTAYAREAEVKKGQDEAQITGSASSYARKYALNGLFAIDDVADADATNTHGKEVSAKDIPVAESEDLEF